MFNKIIKASDGTVLALTEDVTYIKKADNGCYILCPEPDASGISYAGTPYQLFDRDQMGDELETVMLEQTDIGSWTPFYQGLLNRVWNSADRFSTLPWP